MARIKIEGHKDDNNTYGMYSLSFSLVSSPKIGRKQCMNFVSCKAFLHDAIRSYVHSGHPDTKGCHGYEYGVDSEIDMNKLRLLVGTDFKHNHTTKETFRENLFCAKKIVNFYERTAGWTQSRIMEVDHSVFDDVWLMTGPKEWMQSPQLISMITLVIRACTLNGPVEFKTNEDIENIYKKWVDNKNSGIWDRRYIINCWDKLFLVAKHNRKLFDGITPKDSYVLGRNICSHANGIAKLCALNAGTPELNERFKTICGEEGIKISKKACW